MICSHLPAFSTFSTWRESESQPASTGSKPRVPRGNRHCHSYQLNFPWAVTEAAWWWCNIEEAVTATNHQLVNFRFCCIFSCPGIVPRPKIKCCNSQKKLFELWVSLLQIWYRFCWNFLRKVLFEYKTQIPIDGTLKITLASWELFENVAQCARNVG